MYWCWIILGILGYILLWGLTASLLYKFFSPYFEECLLLGVLFPFTLPFAIIIMVFKLFNKLFK